MTKRTIVLFCILSALLCAWPQLAPDPFWLLDVTAKSVPEPIQWVLCIVMIPLMFLHGLSFMSGTGILAWLALRTCLARFQQSHAYRPLILPCLSIVWLVMQATPFLSVPAGSWIRPMGWAALTMLAAFLLMIFSLSASIASLRRQHNKPVSVVAILLSLAIIAVPSFALNAIASIKGFHLSP